MRALRVVPVLLFFALAGCLEPPALPPRPDAGLRLDAWLPSFEVLGTDVRDARGHLWPASATPRRPTIEVHLASPPADPSMVLLVTGGADADLVDDLDAAPLRSTTVARTIAVDATLTGATLALTPRAPLDAGTTLTLAIPRWLTDAGGHRLEAAFTAEHTVSASADAGARATDTWPPDGAFEVAPGLALAAMRFDGTLADPTQSVVLRDAHGPVAISATVAACATIGWPDGVCVLLVPLAALSGGAPHTLALAADARDATGALLPAFAAHFTTSASDPPPLAWASTTCGIGETEQSAGCVRSDDESISFRGQLTAAARVAWTAGTSRGAIVSPRGEVALRILGLAPSSETSFSLVATDYAGARSALTLPLTTTEPLPTISISEIRADPAGPEPRQEYVELENYGTSAVTLEGLRLSDSGTGAGDALPPVSVPPGAHVLVVSTDFDPDETAGGRDVAAPPGAILVRVDASLASGGLSNAGEPLFLRDALDRWISAAPATPPPRSGVCVVRTSASRRTGEPGAFEYDAALTCTPGR